MGNDALDDRRGHFRVDDHIHLRWSELDPAGERALTEELAAGGAACSQVAELRALSTQMSNVLAGIRKRDPEVAQYLTMLDRKIDTVARMLEEQRLGAGLAPNARVNIGAGGMAFGADSALAPGTALDLRLIFFPAFLCIRTLGQVVYCERAPQGEDGEFRVGVEFSAIGDDSRDALIRHLTERQAALLRRRRGDD